jgi:radical SAM protein (TIGR01212 family)
MFEAIKKTKEYGLKVCGHLIYGLPHESQEMMLDSVKASIDLKIDSLKIHSMYITKNTIMANEFKLGKFETISQELYIDTLIKSFKMLPPEIMIQRICAGIDDDSLLSPLWCRNKHAQMKVIKRALKEEGFIY